MNKGYLSKILFVFVLISFGFFINSVAERNQSHVFCGKIKYKQGPIINSNGTFSYKVIIHIDSLNRNFFKKFDSETYFSLPDKTCIYLSNGDLDESYIMRCGFSAFVFCLMFLLYAGFKIFYDEDD